MQSPAPHQKQYSSFEGNSKPSELLLLLLYHSLFSLQSAFYFLSFFPLNEDHAVPFFVHLPLHFLKQQKSRSQDHLCEFKWEQRVGSVSAHPLPHLKLNLSGPRSCCRSWIGWKEMFCSITLTQSGTTWRKVVFQRPRRTHGGEPRKVMVLS